MKTIIETNSLVRDLLGDQQIVPGTPLRPMAFHVTAQVEEGALLYHTMTKELLLLTEEELKALHGEDGPAKMRDYLIRHWFLVPEEHDDCALADQVREIACALANDDEEQTGLEFVTVLTTTDCNARCYYCFEKGYKIESMTEDTAHRTAQYILRNRAPGKTLTIDWFGGEPLFNCRAIDIICEELRAAGCDFVSHFTTNAYLFDPETVEKAVKDWHLEFAQVTIDGTEEVYNRTKAYIYHDNVSPFRKVIGNIKCLLQAGVEIYIRLNACPSNISDLEDLCLYLKKELYSLGKLAIYACALYQFSLRSAKGELEDFRIRLNQLNATLRSERLTKIESAVFEGKLRVNNCAADDRRHVVIEPSGNLTRCQHLGMGPSIGTVDKDEWDEVAFAEWCTVKERGPLCCQCVKYPDCFWLTHCETLQKKTCTPITLEGWHDGTCRYVVRTYREQLKTKRAER